MSKKSLALYVLYFAAGCLSGLFACRHMSNANPDDRYAQQLVLSELRQQANVVNLIMKNDLPRAVDLAITRAQSDLLTFETALDTDDLTVAMPSFCETINYVANNLASYLDAQVEKGRHVKSSLANLKRRCDKAR